jgi:hypothetical protein
VDAELWMGLALSMSLLGAGAVLVWQMWKWTTHGARARRSEWAAARGMSGGVGAGLSGGLMGLGVGWAVIEGYASRGEFVVLVRSSRTPGAKRPGRATVWCLAGLAVDVDGVAGLRPGVPAVSLVDLPAAKREVLSFPSLPCRGEFEVFADGRASAERISAVSAELPADCGLLLRAGWLMLDFTPRGFSPTQLDAAAALLERQRAALTTGGTRRLPDLARLPGLAAERR